MVVSNELGYLYLTVYLVLMLILNVYFGHWMITKLRALSLFVRASFNVYIGSNFWSFLHICSSSKKLRSRFIVNLSVYRTGDLVGVLGTYFGILLIPMAHRLTQKNLSFDDIGTRLGNKSATGNGWQSGTGWDWKISILVGVLGTYFGILLVSMAHRLAQQSLSFEDIGMRPGKSSATGTGWQSGTGWDWKLRIFATVWDANGTLDGIWNWHKRCYSSFVNVWIITSFVRLVLFSYVSMLKLLLYAGTF